MCSQSPCVCSRETMPDDYVILSLSQDLPPPPVQPVAQSSSTPASRTTLDMLKHAFMQAANFVLRRDSCCQENGWTDYPSPNNEEHASIANHIFVVVRKTPKFEIYGDCISIVSYSNTVSPENSGV